MGQWFFLVFLAGVWPYFATVAVLYVVVHYWLAPLARRYNGARKLADEKMCKTLAHSKASAQFATDLIFELERNAVLQQAITDRTKAELYRLENPNTYEMEHMDE